MLRPVFFQWSKKKTVKKKFGRVCRVGSLLQRNRWGVATAGGKETAWENESGAPAGGGSEERNEWQVWCPRRRIASFGPVL